MDLKDKMGFCVHVGIMIIKHLFLIFFYSIGNAQFWEKFHLESLVFFEFD